MGFPSQKLSEAKLCHGHRPWPPKRKTPANAGVFLFGGATRIRTGGQGFAVPCLTTWLWRHRLNGLAPLRSRTSALPLFVGSGSAPPFFLPKSKLVVLILFRAWGVPFVYKFLSLAEQKKWSGRRGSNSLPPPWQGGALPDELRPHIKRCRIALSSPSRNAR